MAQYENFTMQQTANFWSHAPEGLSFRDMIRMTPEEVANRIGTLAVPKDPSQESQASTDFSQMAQRSSEAGLATNAA